MQGLRRLADAARGVSEGEGAGPEDCSGGDVEVAGGGSMSVTDMSERIVGRDDFEDSPRVNEDPVEMEEDLEGDEAEISTGGDDCDVGEYGSDPIEETSPSGKALEGDGLHVLDDENQTGFMAGSNEDDQMETSRPRQEGNESAQETIHSQLDDELLEGRGGLVDNAEEDNCRNESTDPEHSRECDSHTTESLSKSIVSNKDAHAGPQGEQEDDAGRANSEITVT